jgi:hypothetical protein
LHFTEKQLIMKINNIYKLFGLMVLFVALQSRSAGPGDTMGLQVAGAPGSTAPNGTCANCHAENAFAPSATIELLDGSDPVTAYRPGETYTMRVTIAESEGTPSGYGFQAVVLDGSDNQAGSWGTLGADQHTVDLSGRDYVEHNANASTGVFETEWVAPETGTGDVTIYSAGVAGNSNGQTGGDGVASATLTLTEEPVNSTSDLNGQAASIAVLPNPVYENLYLQINSRIAGDFNVKIMDMTGKTVQSAPVSVQNGTQVAVIPVTDLLAGLYVVQLVGDQHLAAVKMLKN